MSLNTSLCRGVVTWFNFLVQLRKLISFLNLSYPSAYSKHYNIQSVLLCPFYELLSKTWMCWWSIGRVFDVKILILFQIFFVLIPFFLFPVLPAQLQAVVIQNLQRRMSSGWRITSSSWKMTGQQWNWQCWSWRASILIPLAMMLNLVETARG